MNNSLYHRQQALREKRTVRQMGAVPKNPKRGLTRKEVQETLDRAVQDEAAEEEISILASASSQPTAA